MLETNLSKRVSVKGSLVLSATTHEGLRLFRFFNTLKGSVRLNRSNYACEGTIHIPLLHEDKSEKKSHESPQITLLEHPISTFSIKIDSLQALKEDLNSKHTPEGQLIGSVEMGDITKALDIPVHLHWETQKRLSIEPKQGLSYSMSELGVTQEVASLLDLDPLGLEDLLSVQFKLQLEAA
jgi:hypothetical protein